MTWLMWMAGLFHFALLPASLSVPKVLDWKKELASASPFTRKVVWVHGTFIAGLIVSFGVLTLLLAEPMAEGEYGVLTGLIGFFWLARLVVQFATYRRSEWPRMRFARLSRIGLTALFAYWAAVYLAASIMAVMR